MKVTAKGVLRLRRSHEHKTVGIILEGPNFRRPITQVAEAWRKVGCPGIVTIEVKSLDGPEMTNQKFSGRPRFRVGNERFGIEDIDSGLSVDMTALEPLRNTEAEIEFEFKHEGETG